MDVPNRVDPETLELARSKLEAGREAIAATEDQDPRGFGGIARVEQFSDLVDEVVGLVVRGAVAATSELEGSVALVALGGYGRRELAPRSDVDLLFLVLDDGMEPFVEAALYGLWDLGLEVGHSVRTPDGTLEWAESEHVVLSSLLDARLLPGGAGQDVERKAAFDYVRRGIDELLSYSEIAKGLLESKLDEGRRRDARYGGSVYLLEPNVKESAGGLRDLHVGLWFSRVRFKTGHLGELLRLGVLSNEEHRTVRRAYDFQLRVRYELHRITERRQDSLRFEFQERIAEILGYVAPGEASHDRKKHGVERFMRAWYFHAGQIRILGSALVERATQVRSIRGVTGRAAPGGFRQWGGLLTMAGAQQFASDPSAMVRIFLVAQDERLDIHPHTKVQLTKQRLRIDRDWRRDRRVVEAFLSLLEAPKYDGAILEQMHDLGILRQIIPEMARVSARWQHSLYHVYTVDAHSLKVVRFAKRIRQGAFRESLPALTRIAEDVPRPAVLYLACLLHDIGKGWPKEDHSERGAKVAQAVGHRLEAADSASWGPEETADLVWLVAQHLLMSDLSQRRDVSDPELIDGFVEAVRTEERLEMLYLLTVADMMGTSPKVWSTWKASLLRELYLHGRAALRSQDGEGVRRHLALRRSRAEAALLEEIDDVEAGREAVRAFVAAVPDRYLLAVSVQRMFRHVRMWSSVRRHGGLATHVAHHRRDGVSRLTVACPDRPGLLALAAGALAANDLSILSASVFSVDPPAQRAPLELSDAALLDSADFELTPDAPTEKRIALDLFYVTDAQGNLCDDPERWARVRRDLEALLVEGADPTELVGPRVFGAGGLSPHRPAVKIEVERVRGVGQEAVIDVFCEDHVGVLFVIAGAMAQRGLGIELAKISTQGHRVADGFYLREVEGGGVPGPARIREAMAAIRESLTRLEDAATTTTRAG